MKKWIAIVLLLVYPIAIFAQSIPTSKTADYEVGFAEGEMSAGQNYSSGGWFAAGLGGGLLLGLIGGGIVVGISQSGTINPPPIHRISLSEKPDDFKMGYYDGYSKKAKKKRLGSTIIGSLIGTTVAVALILNASE